MVVIAQTETEFAAQMEAARLARRVRRELCRGPKKKYHLTILSGGPADHPPVRRFNAGALTWAERTISYDKRSKETHSYPGVTLECTEAQMQDGLTNMRRYVVVWHGNGRRPLPYLREGGMYEELSSDDPEEPLSKYLELVEVKEGTELVEGKPVETRAVHEPPRDAQDARTQKRHQQAMARGEPAPDPDDLT